MIKPSKGGEIVAHTYLYQVRDNRGKLQIGELEAEDQDTAVLRLRQNGLIVTKVEKKTSAPTVEDAWANLRSVSLKDLSIFARQFATMVGAGVSLVKCLAILSEQTSNSKLKGALEEVRYDVESGTALSYALSKHKQIFPHIMLAMVRAGEVGGVLDEVMERLAEHFEKEHELHEKIKSATRYPMIVMAFAILVVIVLFTFVLPGFEKMFESSNAELPTITKITLGIGHFMQANILWILLVMLVGIVVLVKYLRTAEGKERFDRLLINVPVFGPLTVKVGISRVSRTLATLLHSGVPIVQAIEISHQTAGNVVISTALLQVRDSIAKGQGMAGPLQQSGVFPPMVTQMIAVGEETGSMDTMLSKVADFYEKEVKYMTDNLSALIEPFLVAFLGIVVGLIVLSIMLPMAEISGAAGM